MQLPNATYSLHCRRPQAYCFTEHSFSSQSNLTQGTQTQSQHSSRTKTSVSILWEYKLISKAIFRASVQRRITELKRSALRKERLSREERQGVCCFLNSNISIFRPQLDATRKGFELAAIILKGVLRGVVLFILHRSQHQMLGSKCAFCTHRDHSYRSSTSNFMAHQVNKPAEEIFMVCRTVIIYNSKFKAVA